MIGRALRTHHDEHGAETVEFAIVLPVLLLMVLSLYPVVEFMAVHRDVGRVADETAVFATRSDDNPSPTAANAVCGSLTRRRSHAEVDEFARGGHPAVTRVDVYVQAPGAPTPDTTSPSSANPCTAPASSRIHVRLTAAHSTGPATATVNALGRLIGAGDLLPTTIDVAATSTAYLE